MITGMNKNLSRTWIVLIVIILASPLHCTSHPQPPFIADVAEKKKLSGKVIKISDGDTFHMLLEGNRSIKVRLFGIDCPEQQQPFYQQAKNTLAELIFQKNITIETNNKDQYGRYLATAFSNGRCINEEMLRRGMAWHFRRYDHDLEWSSLQEVAKKRRLGLWSDPNPTAPWAFRKTNAHAN